MTRFVVASAAALALAFATAADAHAQIVYGYTVPQGGGFVTNRTAVGPYGYQSYNQFYSPFTGMSAGQAFGSNIFGQAFNKSYAYNPWTGAGFRSGFYQPNYYAFPNLGYGYGFFNRPW